MHEIAQVRLDNNSTHLDEAEFSAGKPKTNHETWGKRIRMPMHGMDGISDLAEETYARTKTHNPRVLTMEMKSAINYCQLEIRSSKKI